MFAVLLHVLPATGQVYVIPVENMIERGLVYVVRRGVQEAVQAGADAIVFDLNTPGGRLDAAEEIINLIANLDIPTFALVNPEAISAGAMIALATDRIYMTPGGRIGDAMPLMMSPFGGAQEMSEGMEEKAVSYVAALIRSTAERKGHDPQLAEAMVRRSVEYRIGEDLISAEGELLTLTTQEAERWVDDGQSQRRLLSAGTVQSLDDLLAAEQIQVEDIIWLRPALAEQIARYIEFFSVVFLAGGLLGVYIEFRTPGFGFPGLTGIALLAIWFWGHHIAGLAGMTEIAVFLIALLLLAIEIFVLPGFGIAGITGIVLMIVSLMMAMIQNYPGMPWWQPPAIQVQTSLNTVAMALVLTFATALLLGRFLPQTTLFKRITLAAAADREHGFEASDHTTSRMIGRTGTTVTALRPAGVANIDGERMDVITQGGYLDAGTEIVIAEAHGNRILVAPVGVPSRTREQA